MPAVSIFKDFGKNIRTVIESPLFCTVALLFLFFAGIQTFSEFKFKTVLGINYHGEALVEIIGLVFFAKSAFSFLVNTFLTKKFLFRFGVADLLISLPVILFIALMVAVFFNMHPFAVIFYFVVFSLPTFTYYPISVQQILSLNTKEKMQAVYFFLRGVVFSFSMLMMSLFLIVYSYDIHLESTLNTVLLFVFFALFFVFALRLKKLYFGELQNSLYKNDPFLRSRAVELFAEKVHKGARVFYLIRLLKMPHLDEELRIKIISSLGIIGDSATLIDLIKLLKEGSHKERFAAIQAIKSIIKDKRAFKEYPVSKHLVIESLEALCVSDVPLYLKLEAVACFQYFDLEDIVAFLEKHLKSVDPQMQSNIIETLGSFHDRAIVYYIEPFLKSGHVRVLSGAIIALWQFKDMRLTLLMKIASLLSRSDPEAVESSLFLIGALKAVWEKKYVLEKLHSGNRHLRTYALIVLIQLGEHEYVSQLLDVMVHLIQESHKEEIEFVFGLYRRFDRKVKDQLIGKIQHFNPSQLGQFFEAFQRSKYVFSHEISELS